MNVSSAAVKTEFFKQGVMNNEEVNDLTKEMLSMRESTEFVCRAVVHLQNDTKIMNKSGCIFMTLDLARDYGFKDIDGKMPVDPQSVKTQLRLMGCHAHGRVGEGAATLNALCWVPLRRLQVAPRHADVVICEMDKF